MANGQTPQESGKFFEKLPPQRRNIGLGLIGLGVALSSIPIANVALYGWQSLAVFIWGTAIALLALVAGFICTTMVPATPDKEAERLRILALVVLGGFGSATALLGFLLPFCASPFSVTDYRAIVNAGVSKWRERENAFAMLRCVAALLGGLVAMFLALSQTRVYERSSPRLRRVQYGYNAVLSSLLLIFIVVLLNLLPYAKVWPFTYVNESIDWTRTGLHTIHDATRNVVADLKQPVKVYAFGSSSDMIMRDVRELLDGCRNINPQMFHWEQLSRDRNATMLRELESKYKLVDSQGLLVVYGTDKKEMSEFIRYNDLFKPGSNPREARYQFKGENALLNALVYLSANKNRAVVYFTQGNGELSMKERMAAGSGLDTSMSQLIEELGRVNYETRELAVEATTDKIPDDAEIVVVARPAQPYPEKFLKALRDYLHGVERKEGKKGQMIVLFDVVTESGKNTMVRTGLENLVAEYGIRVNENQLVDLDPPSDYYLIQGLPPRQSNNPIAKAFANEAAGTLSIFHFYRTRTLDSTSPPAPGGAPPSNQPDVLVRTMSQRFFISQTDLSAKPSALIAEIQRDPSNVEKMLNRSPLALAVSEGGSAAPPIQGHEFMAKEGQPRLVVFGDASWISNGLLLRPSPNNYNLFASCLSWLARRPDLGTQVPTAEHDIYELKAPQDTKLRLLLLPGFLMMLAVLALGVGVWVVRRR